MQKFTAVTGLAAPLMKANIDTDAIIPAKCLVGHRRDQLGAFCFEAYRYRPDRSENPDFVLNQSRYRGAQVLVTGENFGCGSSRESAVWALADLHGAIDDGIRAIVAPSFGDIFESNCSKNGLLCVRLEPDVCRKARHDLRDREPVVALDLPAQAITLPDGTTRRFAIDPFRKQCLVEGLDDISLTLREARAIEAHEQGRAASPWRRGR